MTRINKILTIIASAVFLSLGGCTVRVADLTLVSTKNIDLSDVKLDLRKGKRASGEDCRFVFLSLIPFGLPNMQQAVDDALESEGGNILIDQVTEIKQTWVVLGTISCYVVKGTVLNIPEGS